MTAAVPAAAACPHCGAPLQGAWCHACGQRAPAPDDFTAARFFAAAWQELSDGDSRSWRTLRHLLLPGVLTRAFLDHQWRAYLPPLRLYLIVSGVFFLLCWDTWYAVQAGQMDPQLWLQQVPPDKRELALAAFNDPGTAERASDLTALLRFLAVLALGALVALLQRGRRLPFGAHLVFATHYYVFDFALFTLATPLVLLLQHSGQDALVGPLILALSLSLLVWAVLATRRVYARGWRAAIAAGLVILVVDLLLSSLAGQLGFGAAVGLGMGEQEARQAAAAALSPH